jgi:ribosomal protein L9
MATNGKSVNEDIPIDRELACKLTEQELLERGDRMAEAELKIEAHKAERKHVNAQIAQQVEQRALLAHVIESGVELRSVTCKWIADRATNQWRLVRQDSGAEVEARPMTAGDHQAELDLRNDPSENGEIDDDGELLGHDDDEVEADDSADVLVDDRPRPQPKPKRKPAPKKKAAPAKAKAKSTTRRFRAHA